MKCSKCGHRANSLPAMARHYRKKHPASMKRTAKAAPRQRKLKAGRSGIIHFCPHCGGEINPCYGRSE